MQRAPSLYSALVGPNSFVAQVAYWTMAEEREVAEETALRLLQAALQQGLQTEEAAAASGLGTIYIYIYMCIYIYIYILRNINKRYNTNKTKK